MATVGHFRFSRPAKPRLSHDPVIQIGCTKIIQFGVLDRKIQLTATKRLTENDRPWPSLSRKHKVKFTNVIYYGTNDS
ncbi:10861_t:CDS:2 [Scutellospora calospora]|uniref:10861_t:CDS:1 n=1 Tax=Scutellospora calospora TaxID=85575 RepID=A0ACA9KLT8_9GLOM|nr:10861_t:CDS:2 [Scutellospora calospora]